MLMKILSVLSIATFLTGHALATNQSSDTSQTPSETLEKWDQLDVTIYTSRGCFACHRAKDLFNERQIPYTEKVVDNNPALFAEMKKKTKQETVPQVIINGKHVGSYRHLMWGGLDTILEEELAPHKKGTQAPNQ